MGSTPEGGAAPPVVAYFSMEIALDPGMPTYSGGLGVLAGDTLRAAADHGVPMVGLTLLYRKGYFRQHLDERGNQSEAPSEWSPEEHLVRTDTTAVIRIEGRAVTIGAWRYDIVGVGGDVVPVYSLDTDLEVNDPVDRALSGSLYAGDARHRLSQEAVLGLGGVAVLEALGHGRIATCHMNEGHSALLSLALLRQERGGGLDGATGADRDRVRGRCVFTTHTPVPAGHDRFPIDLVRNVLGDEIAQALESGGCLLDGELNMTFLGLHCSRYVNGVSMRHEQVSEGMFPGYPFNSITNGVHAVTWTSQPFRDLLDRHVPEWRRDNRYLRYAVGIPVEEVQQAHAAAKRELVEEVEKRCGRVLDPNAMTIGFARRATRYKRADLLFSDLERLRRIARDVGPIQLLYAGKAHPSDGDGKEMIRRIFGTAESLADAVPLVYLEDYDLALGARMVSGVDLWLNTPQKPQEASGTSGMKAALNGVPSLSVLDGWWIEGHVEGVTGWSIGDDWQTESRPDEEAASLYDKLEFLILPTFYTRPAAYAKIMRSAVALNGSFFNSQRMVSQYVENAYDIE